MEECKLCRRPVSTTYRRWNRNINGQTGGKTSGRSTCPTDKRRGIGCARGEGAHEGGRKEGKDRVGGKRSPGFRAVYSPESKSYLKVAVESRFRSSFGMPLINLGLESQPDASDSQLVSENQNARVCQLLTNRRDIVPDPSKKKQPKSFVLEQNFYGTATKLIESKLANAMRKSRTWWWLCVHAHAKRNLLDRDPRHVTLIYFFLPLPLFPSFQ
ncbi:uncharacterized protein LOC105664394 isoform X1 [Megachile rotundata]|uniref:uncharacterized protein LOC105664394 isoform X1 n=1 Tax=Megachile rotundata TaxID=143995 RepID=UPI003FD0E419